MTILNLVFQVLGDRIMHIPGSSEQLLEYYHSRRDPVYIVGSKVHGNFEKQHHLNVFFIKGILIKPFSSFIYLPSA